MRRLHGAPGRRAPTVLHHAYSGRRGQSSGRTTPDAYGIVTKLRRQHPKVAIVWIGDEPPEIAHASLPHDQADAERVPGAVTRALIAHR